MADKPPAFTVTDRRKFTEDGELRNPAEAAAPEAPAAPVGELAAHAAEAVHPAPGQLSAHAAEAVHPAPGQLSAHMAEAVHPAPGQLSAHAAEAVHPAPGQLGAHIAEAVHPAPGQFSAAAEPAAEPPRPTGARVVTMPSPARPAEPEAAAAPAPAPAPVPAAADAEDFDGQDFAAPGLEEPTAAEAAEQQTAYETTTRQLDELLRQQNPGMKETGPVGIEHVFQSIYLSAVVAMGAATEPGQKPRIDILGARQSIDMLAALEEKTKGNLSETQARLLTNLLFELRMMFLEITNAIAQQAHNPPPGR